MHTSSRNFCKSKHGFSFLQMLIHPNKMGNLEMINLLCENSSKHIAASFPDGEIRIHQAFHQPLIFTWIRLCVCSIRHFPAHAHTPPSLLWLFKEVLTISYTQNVNSLTIIFCHVLPVILCTWWIMAQSVNSVGQLRQWHLVPGVIFNPKVFLPLLCFSIINS